VSECMDKTPLRELLHVAANKVTVMGLVIQALRRQCPDDELLRLAEQSYSDACQAMCRLRDLAYTQPHTSVTVVAAE
jgi:hypothetical protein